jgi:hypothetical protein
VADRLIADGTAGSAIEYLRACRSRNLALGIGRTGKLESVGGWANGCLSARWKMCKSQQNDQAKSCSKYRPRNLCILRRTDNYSSIFHVCAFLTPVSAGLRSFSINIQEGVIRSLAQLQQHRYVRKCCKLISEIKHANHLRDLQSLKFAAEVYLAVSFCLSKRVDLAVENRDLSVMCFSGQPPFIGAQKKGGPLSDPPICKQNF